MPDGVEVTQDAHARLRAHAFLTAFRAPLAELATPPAITRMLAPDADAPFDTDEQVRAAVRDLLRTGGFKPTGRSKPSPEYLARTAYETGISPINAAVDACNAVSLHSGLPISVVDLSRANAPFHIAVAPDGARYVFNASDQEIDVAGLLCLFDRNGPCANAVKDAQRTKTGPATVHTLSIVWGCAPFEDRAASATAWYRGLLQEAGGDTEPIAITERAG